MLSLISWEGMHTIGSEEQVRAGTRSSTPLSQSLIFLSQDPSCEGGSHSIIEANEDIMFYCWLPQPFKFIHL